MLGGVRYRAALLEHLREGLEIVRHSMLTNVNMSLVMMTVIAMVMLTRRGKIPHCVTVAVLDTGPPG